MKSQGGYIRAKDIKDNRPMYDQLLTEVLADAIKNTFQNRGTSYVENHPLFTDDFYKDTNRIARWKGFLKGINWQENISFETIGQTIKSELSDYWVMLKHQ